jgi:hypothetical protein
MMKRCYKPSFAVREDRRLAIERRRFSYADFIPERRSGKNRRDTDSLFHPSDPFPVRTINGKLCILPVTPASLLSHHGATDGFARYDEKPDVL